MMNKFTKSLAITMSAVTLLTGVPCSADNVPTKAELAVKSHNKVSRLRETIEIIGGICVGGAVGLGIYFLAAPHVKEWIAIRKTDSSKTGGNKSGEEVAPSTPTKKPEDMTVEEWEKSGRLQPINAVPYDTKGMGFRDTDYPQWYLLHEVALNAFAELMELYEQNPDNAIYYVESRLKQRPTNSMEAEIMDKKFGFLLKMIRDPEGAYTLCIKESGSTIWIPTNIFGVYRTAMDLSGNTYSPSDVVPSDGKLGEVQELTKRLWDLGGNQRLLKPGYQYAGINYSFYRYNAQ